MTTEIHQQLEGRDLGLGINRGLVVQDDKGNTYRLTPQANEAVDMVALAAELNQLSASINGATVLGALKAGVTGLTGQISHLGKAGKGTFFTIDLTFTAMPVTHTDAGAGGSSGSQELFDFVQGAVLMLGSRADLVITADNVLDNGTTLAGVVAFGSVAATAHDGSLSGTEVDFAAASGTLTATAHVLTSASLLKGAGTAKDGTTTAAKLFLNESCSAATSVANGTLLVTGTATFVGVILGDD